MLDATDLTSYREECHAEFSGRSEAFVEYYVAANVLGELVGRDWVLRQLGRRSADPFLLMSSEDGSLEQKVSHARIMRMARDLFEMQHLDGFDDFRKDLRSRSLMGAAIELQVAHLFFTSGRKITFAQRSGVKGKDYDMAVQINTAALAVEVKAKSDDTVYSPQTVVNSLKSARKQLPPGGPGLVVLRIPATWAYSPDSAAEIPRLVIDHLRTTRRVNAVTVVWETYFLGTKESFAEALLHQTFLNRSASTPSSGLDSLIRTLGSELRMDPAQAFSRRVATEAATLPERPSSPATGVFFVGMLTKRPDAEEIIVQLVSASYESVVLAVAEGALRFMVRERSGDRWSCECPTEQVDVGRAFVAYGEVVVGDDVSATTLRVNGDTCDRRSFNRSLELSTSLDDYTYAIGSDVEGGNGAAFEVYMLGVPSEALPVEREISILEWLQRRHPLLPVGILTGPTLSFAPEHFLRRDASPTAGKRSGGGWAALYWAEPESVELPPEVAWKGESDDA